MCGITGILSAEPVPDGFVEACCETIRHRGPDDTGVHVDGGLGLGMDRLAIIDLDTGHQPLYSSDRQVVLVFNGEIYNFRELRAELERAGMIFHTRSDTEVILNGYLAWGRDVLARLNGIFAIALWDGRSRQLLLARDPLGVKPLYYFQDAKRFVFSSEIKTFTQMGIANAVSREAVAQYLGFGYVFHPGTAIRGVRQLEAGQAMLVSDDRAVEAFVYRTLPRLDPRPMSEEEGIELVESGLQEAIVRQMVSDVPVGLLLSAGLDSMFILGALLRHGYRDLRTFTVQFDDPSFSEHGVVERVTADLGVRNDMLRLTSEEVAGHVEQLGGVLDNLEFLPTAVAMYFVSRLAGRQCKVVLSGVGGDELFYGYPTYQATRMLRRLGPLAAALPALRPAAGLLPGGGYMSLREKSLRFLEYSGRPADLAHVNWRAVFNYRRLRGVLTSSYFDSTLEALSAPQTRYYARAQELNWRGMDRYAYVDMKTWLVDCALGMWDKTGMNASLEIRVPFLDLEFLDRLAQIPFPIRSQRPGGKGLLRKAGRTVLPQAVLDLPKHGFQVPVDRWLRGDLRASFEEYTRDLPATVISRPFVDRLWAEYLDGRADHSLAIWVLGGLALWARRQRVDWDG